MTKTYETLSTTGSTASTSVRGDTPTGSTASTSVRADSWGINIRDSQDDTPPRELHHIAYLNRLLTEGLATKLTVDAAHSAWNTARNAAGSTLPIPASVVGEGGEIHYAWDNSPHHMEAEIFPDGRIEWVYVDRETGATWFSDEFGFSAPPVEFEAKISLMCNCPV